MSHFDTVNTARHAALKELLAEEFQPFMTQYIAFSIDSMQELVGAIKSDDLRAIKDTVHKLKPSSLQIGLDKLHAHIQQIEHADTIEAATPLCKALIMEHKAAIMHLNEADKTTSS